VARVRIHPRWGQIGVALLLSTALWLSIKLVRTYTLVLDLPVAYQSVPNKLTFNEPLPARWELSVRGPGHMLLLPSLKLSADSFKLDLSSYIKRRYLLTNSLQEQIEERFPGAVSITDIRPDSLNLDFQLRHSKRVRVISQVRPGPQPGYHLLDSSEYAILPEYVTLTGSKSDLEGLTTWPTQELAAKNLAGFNAVPAAMLPDERFAITPKTVTVQFRSQRYTEMSYDVPVEIINEPYGVKLRVLPSIIKVHCQVPLQDFEEVDLSRFRLRINYRKLPKGARFAVPEVVQRPDNVRYIRLEPPSVTLVAQQTISASR